ncbi:MAG: MBL fold metallo-hydrolase [Anaerolineales bacterium]
MDSVPIRTYTTSQGAWVAQLPITAFPGLPAWVYLVIVDDYRVLIDTGSGFGGCNQQLLAAIQQADSLLGGAGIPQSLTHILITHAHIDHFGGLPFLRERTSALVGVHELDLRVLTCYEERLALVARRLNTFLVEAGVRPERRAQLMEMYLIAKKLGTSQPVDFTYQKSGMRLGPFEMLHVPGHSAGHVMIRLHDILFSGDHILEDISPHQAPEQLTLYTGLGHYLESLARAAAWAGNVRLVLGGHKEPITDLRARANNIRQLHENRLQTVLELLSEPHTIAEVSKAMFGAVRGYHVLLALEEAGAHIEYLYQRGLLRIANYPALGDDLAPQPLQYVVSDDRRQTTRLPDYLTTRLPD